MSRTIARKCDKCKQYEIQDDLREELKCPSCGIKWGEVSNPDQIFDRCPICECRQFYLAKDFNQFVGCLIMLVGIVLVPFTFGLSLPVFAFIDWMFYKKVQSIVVCYRCSSEFRGFDTPKHLKPFMHHIGMKYDKDR